MARADDWLKSTSKQRKDLYQAVRRLMKLGDLSWDAISRDALGRDPVTMTRSFIENFRQGRISASDASRIYRFLEVRHPACITELDTAAFTAKKFRELLLSQRRLGMIEILPERIGPPFRATRLGPEWAEYPFEANDPICFGLRLPFVYEAAIGMNGSVHGWFPMALEQPTDYELAHVYPPLPWLMRNPLIKPVTQGAQTICTPAPGPQEAKRRRGTNTFVFIVGDVQLIHDFSETWRPERQIADTELDRLAEALKQNRLNNWAITQINASGIAPYTDD
jgi:hypothetical protein